MNNMMNRRRFGSLLAVSGIGVFVPTIGGALAMPAGQVAHRLNKADRMSMLTERVAKAVALASLGVNIEEDIDQLQNAHDEFDDILLGFATGEGNSGITKERIVGVRNKIKVVVKLWAPLRVAIEEIVASGKVDDAHFEAVESNDQALERASHDVVKAIEDAYGGGDIDLGLALAIDLAGRQRMLTQKMVKDLAFAALEYDVDVSQKDFKKNCVKFGKIIDVLITGGGGIISISLPPTESAAAALDRVKAHWVSMEPLAKELHQLAKPSAEQVALFAAQSEILLEECESVTDQYEKYVAGIA